LNEQLNEFRSEHPEVIFTFYNAEKAADMIFKYNMEDVGVSIVPGI
jgi:hypothetical protein